MTHLKGTHHPKSRPILQFSRDGTFIKEWDCIQQAVDSLNVTQALISRVCIKEGKYTAAGFLWRYKDKNPRMVEVDRIKKLEDIHGNRK